MNNGLFNSFSVLMVLTIDYNDNLRLFFITLCLLRGQSPMHVLGHYGRENAAAIFELFLECMPEYPLDKLDNEGNTGTVAGLIYYYLYY